MDKKRFCSFCHKSNHEVEVLIAGDDVYICDTCVEISRDIIGSYRIEKQEEQKGNGTHNEN